MPYYKRMLLAVLFLAAFVVRADQVQMLNGDRYAGTVVSLTSDTLVLQSEVLGRVLLPRSRVAVIALGNAPMNTISPATPAVPAPAVSGATAKTNYNFTASARSLGTNVDLIPKIREQYLATAGPTANNKFDQILGGLSSGQMDMKALRAEAKATLDQIDALKKDPNSGIGDAYDSYLDVLKSFLNETQDSTANPLAPQK